MTGHTRRWLLAGVCVLIAIAVAAGVVARGPRRPAPPASPPPVAKALLQEPPARPFLMYISLTPDETFKRVVIAPLGSPDGARYVTPLQCDRVYFAGTRGLCLTPASDQTGAVSYVARVFDERFTALHTMTLTGAPSRTRLSPDGRRAAFTVFDEGHSYADNVFSTRTTIMDTSTGAAIGDLESWAVTRDGKPFKNRDFNFWGVTFAPDGNTFYATLRTQGSAYLIEGDVDARRAHVVMQGAECPSLSPDHTRVAFKRRLGGSEGWWQISVFDLSTRAVRALAGESASVDDQVEWLDDHDLIYFRPVADGNIVWRLAVDAGGAPQPFVREGFSPAVVR